MRLFALAAASLALLVGAPAAAREAGVAAAPTHAKAKADAPRFTAAVEGAGPDILLVPGLASSPEIWDRIAAALRGRYRLHRIHVAGFAGAATAGNADGAVVAPLADALADYIAENRLKAPAVIGHSLGGAAALMLAARHPQTVGRIMAVDSLPFYSLLFSPAATAETMRPQADMMRAMILGQTDAQAAAGQPDVIARLIKTESARPAAVAAANASDRNVVARAMHELMVTDLRPELGRISVPLDVVYAYDPAYGTPAERIDTLFREAYKGAAAARLERIDGSFHFVMLDRPDAFAAAVERFLAATPGQQD